MQASAQQQVLVTINAVSKTYHRGNQPIPVLEGISFEIVRGEFLALMGPSGSGKSTLLNLIAGIDTVDSGSIVIDGVDIAMLDDSELARWRAAHVGFIFQFYNLIPVLTAYENVELPLLLTSLSRRERREHVEAALDVVSLSDRLEHYPSQLSGGQQQRVAIVRAIAIKPRFLLFDEPTSALDPEMTAEVLEVIEELRREGRDLIMATHHIGFARQVADHCLFVCDGAVAEAGPAARLFNDPQTAALQNFLARVLRY
jgi:putative ABC transport system ATP-binding protein